MATCAPSRVASIETPGGKKTSLAGATAVAVEMAALLENLRRAHSSEDCPSGQSTAAGGLPGGTYAGPRLPWAPTTRARGAGGACPGQWRPAKPPRAANQQAIPRKRPKKEDFKNRSPENINGRIFPTRQPRKPLSNGPSTLPWKNWRGRKIHFLLPISSPFRVRNILHPFRGSHPTFSGPETQQVCSFRLLQGGAPPGSAIIA